MADDKPLVLIVEDDPDIASGLERGLAGHGYATQWEERTEPALEALASPATTAAIIDVMIGEESGVELVRAARDQGVTKPLLMLSALDAVADRAAGIEAGADDYIVKPFSLTELVARLKVQEQRAEVRAPKGVVLDKKTRTVQSATGDVELTEREFQMLTFLAERKGDIIPRWEIFEALWVADGRSSENIVDVYIGYLRKKLQPPERFSFEIKTIRNRGFTLTDRG